MRQQIDSRVSFHGLTVRVDKFLELWATWGGNQLEILPFKRDLRYWNNGPTSMQPKKMVHAFTNGREKHTVGIFEIWERQDGFGMDVFKFDSMEDYNNYHPSDEMPDAFKREIGFSDYHKGIL